MLTNISLIKEQIQKCLLISENMKTINPFSMDKQENGITS